MLAFSQDGRDAQERVPTVPPAGTRLQAGKAFSAASTAATASSFVPSGKRPMTCLASQGLTDSKVRAAPTRRPPIRFSPWIGQPGLDLAEGGAKRVSVGLDREIGEGLV